MQRLDRALLLCNGLSSLLEGCLWHLDKNEVWLTLCYCLGKPFFFLFLSLLC